MAHRTIAASPLAGYQIKERLATAAAIKPGMLLQLNTADTVQAHATAGGTAIAWFATEDENQGGSVSTDYAVSVLIRIGHFASGGMVVCRIANGQTIIKGSFLESAGTGYMRIKSTFDSASDIAQPNSVILMALEAVDMSGSSGEDPADLCLACVL